MFRTLSPGKIYLDYGPVQMTIAAYKNNIPMHKEVEKTAGYVEKLLAEVAAFLKIAKLPVGKVKNDKKLPVVLQRMVQAVRCCGDSTFTPMAAVAGSFADTVADYLQEKGATKVIVNNGGDIALRLEKGERIKVGIVSSLKSGAQSHSIEIDHASNIGGIATSGLGGRSLTRGIASAAIALGVNCRQADACATLIGNFTYSHDPAIKQVTAEKIDPDTDIPGLFVTLDVGKLLKETPKKALDNGISKAKELCRKQIIKGAIIFVDGQMAVEPEGLILKLNKF